MKNPARRGPLVEVRHSPIHGHGVFALRRIRKGTTVIEYLGERLSHARADARYEDKDPADNHTFLFTVDSRTVIDGGVDGNDARYINHGCDPNCESVTKGRRIFIEAIRTIQAGEELAYDYQIERDPDDAPDVDRIFACRCGARNCRGTMLEPLKRRIAKPRGDVLETRKRKRPFAKPRNASHRMPGKRRLSKSRRNVLEAAKSKRPAKRPTAKRRTKTRAGP